MTLVCNVFSCVGLSNARIAYNNKIIMQQLLCTDYTSVFDNLNTQYYRPNDCDKYPAYYATMLHVTVASKLRSQKARLSPSTQSLDGSLSNKLVRE